MATVALTTDDLIGAIYEAGALPEHWPATLQSIADWLGARGGNLIHSSAKGIQIVSSPGVEEITREFDRQGWNRSNSRVSRRLARCSHPGFLCDSDLHSAEELATLPLYAEFLNPRQAAAGSATVIQGAQDDGVIIAIEAFKDHHTSRQASAMLDPLRPHLARASVLSSQAQTARAANLIQAFDCVGTAIALLDRHGKAIAITSRFSAEAAGLISDGPVRLRMREQESDRRLAEAIAQIERSGTGTSIVVNDERRLGAAVLHLIPARRHARELLSRVTAFAVLAKAGNDLLPQADVIAALFDLTPAEARVARALAGGMSPTEVARQAGVSRETIRSQLKKVFAKTSTRRQSELASLISRLR